jgi:hypothetical protein
MVSKDDVNRSLALLYRIHGISAPSNELEKLLKVILLVDGEPPGSLTTTSRSSLVNPVNVLSSEILGIINFLSFVI